MYDNIKEIYIGVVLSKNRKGEEVSSSIYLRGRPVPKGVYSRRNPPPGPWTWDKFVELCLPHNGHGIDIIYVGDEWPKKKKPETKEVNE